MRKIFLLLTLCFGAFISNAQSVVTGKVVDEESNEPLIGATVLVKGTTNGTITDLNGDFTINVAQGATLVISYVGYVTKELSATSNMGDIMMKSDAVVLDGFEVIASVAQERKTPVAVSRLSSKLIEVRASNQEFPELLKSTPGVYATKQGGGFGDARVNIRGFGSENVAVMINGIPVNDMENGAVYWSNWAGLTSVASSVQVQRGLGAAKVAVPSIGGTINIVTKPADSEQGGTITYGIGNNRHQTVGFKVSSGLTDKGWAFTAYGSKTTGDGWAQGLNYEAYNYFFTLSKAIGEDHTIILTGFGAPQTHGQRYNRQTIDTWRNNPDGLKYNADWGYLNGQVYNASYNFYHKPQFSLNHYWTINDKSELATSVYFSNGKGGGRRDGGDGFGEVDGQYDYQSAYDANLANGGEALSWVAASNNNHNWFGALSTYTREINSNFDLLAGVDIRQYQGLHYYTVTDLLGADYVLSDDNVTGTVTAIGQDDKYNKNYRGLVGWQGAFVQTEYTEGDLAAFLNASVSNTSYAHDEKMYENRKSATYSFLGYQVKGGANYNLTANHNVFANLGYFSKAPIFDAVFTSERSNDIETINEDAANEKVMSFELGYGYRSKSFSANVNIYRTSWLDKSYSVETSYDLDASGNVVEVGSGVSTEVAYANILGVDALHQGIEMDFKYIPSTVLEVRGMFSLGDWTWADNAEGSIVRDANTGDVIEDASVDGLFIKDLKVGNSAQTTASLDIDYTIMKGLQLGLSTNYFGDMYANYSVTGKTTEPTDGNVVQPWKAPAYTTADLRLVYSFGFFGKESMLIGNINNLFNEEYISDASDVNGTASAATVYYGIGRTWTATIKINF